MSNIKGRFQCIECKRDNDVWPLGCKCAEIEDARIRDKMVGSLILVSRMNKSELMEFVMEKKGEVFFISETYWRSYNDGFYRGVNLWGKFSEMSFQSYLQYTRPECYRYIDNNNHYEIYEPDAKRFNSRDKGKEWIPSYDCIKDDKERSDKILSILKK